MNAGKYRHRVQIQSQKSQKDTYGNTAQGWSNLSSSWGNLRETTGKERVAHGSIESRRTATLRLPASNKNKLVTAAERVIVRGVVWEILGISNADDKGDTLDMLLEENPTPEATDGA